MPFGEEYEKQFQRYGNKHGLDINFTYGGIFIRSRKGNWRAEQNDDGDWVLFHKNESYRRPVKREGYHLHQKSWKSFWSLLEYIVAHDKKRYTNGERSERKFKNLRSK